MEFLIVSISVAAIVIASVILYLSFNKDLNSQENELGSLHFKSQKKICTQDGMRTKKSNVSGPLHVFGDSKRIA